MLGKARKCFKLNIKGIFIPIRTPGTQKIEQISQKKQYIRKDGTTTRSEISIKDIWNNNVTSGTKYSRMDQVKFFKGCLSQILLGSLVNTLSQVKLADCKVSNNFRVFFEEVL